MEIRTRDVPAQHVVSEQRRVDQAALEAWLPGAMARMAAAATAAGGLLGTSSWPYLDRAGADQPVFVVIYEGDPHEGPTPVEVCAPIADAGAATRTVPAHREAYLRVTKEQVVTGALGGVYEGIEKWIGEQGLVVAAAPRETYWTDFPAAGAQDPVFDVAFPVAARG
ncbi:hypothetical protein GCM10020358_35740 [Amorphoplanes nipponensis]|uniref:Effector-binding domain-containing protein n=1 Tax=Actinoplanes nipponensis TaxID=135950 RepID=A0A919JF38_9ACTN|nr:hypothetical protein [Actinoplanes nipponensis]GIE48608.1 hypothetical protein Ani05nite_21420 [Actinoplanes nipponensis]